MKDNFKCLDGDCSNKNCAYFRVFDFCDVSETDCVWYGECGKCRHTELCEDCIFFPEEKGVNDNE